MEILIMMFAMLSQKNDGGSEVCSSSDDKTLVIGMGKPDKECHANRC